LKLINHKNIFHDIIILIINNIIINRIFDLYPQLKDNIQRIIRIEIQPLIRSIGLDSPKLLEVIRNFKPGADALAIRVLFILTNKCSKYI